MNWLELLEQCTWAATFILLAGFAASWAMQTAPSAWRHFLWTAALAGLLVLPAMVRVMPKWAADPMPPAAVTLTVSAPAGEPTRTVPAAPDRNPVLLVWLAGCALAAVRFLAGWAQVARMVRHASEAIYAREPMDAAGGSGIRVVQSVEARTALAAGILRPAVVLPADSGAWPVARLRAALLHEWMHIRRRDLLAQAVAQAACCLYWFHPLAWLAARQMRREREQACDDAVLGRGIAAQDYAGHLVDSARAMRGQRTGALAMAEPSELERRVRALLDGGRDRRPLNRAAAGVMVTALASVLLPAAAIAVHAQAAPVPERAYAVHAPPQLTQHDAQAQPVPESSRSIPVAAEVSRPQAATTISMGDALRETYRRQVAQTAALAAARPDQQTAPAAGGLGGISGVVQDPSGARIPNCWITVKDADGSNEQSTFTNTAGAYQFPSLPAGRYTLQVSSPGFKKATLTALSVQPSQTMTANLRLQIGAVTESVTVKAARPAVVAAPAVEAATAGERLRVGGMVQPAMIIRKVAPVYPEDLRAQGITGTVHLAAIIGKQGNLTEIHPLSGPNPGLIAAAMEAASHWVYQPTLLNGEPVMVETTIDITFELQ